MDIYTDAIQKLPAADKLLLVERIWGDLASPDTTMPISSEVIAEVKRRREAMVSDPNFGKTHEEVWARIEAWRNG
jgi:putative addiction module component (TIGR02574 family)